MRSRSNLIGGEKQRGSFSAVEPKQQKGQHVSRIWEAELRERFSPSGT
jgi:hypothetical protein